MDLRRQVISTFAIILTLAFLGVAPFVGHFLQKGMQRPAIGCDPDGKNVGSAYRLQQALELEEDGNVAGAEEDYKAALTSDNSCIRVLAHARLQRLSIVRARWGPAYSVVVAFSTVSQKSRPTVIAVLISLALPWLLLKALPRRGTRMGNFPVYGSIDESSSQLFRDALVWFANEIKRIYSSEYARSMGITLLFDDLKGEQFQTTSAYEQALAEAKDPNAKAAVSFAIGRALQAMRDATERPHLTIEGDVRLFPGMAKVVATIKDNKSGTDIMLEANTNEVLDLPTSVQDRLLVQMPAIGNSATSRRAGELRQNSMQLYTLAVLLACKIRFTQLQVMTTGYKPATWKTVCLFTVAAASLE